MISVKVFHIAIPAVRKITNGTSPDGLTLNPILNTNHKIDIMSNGLINAQKKPRKEPTYRVEISRLAISMIKNLRSYNASMNNIKLLNKFTGLRINFIYSQVLLARFFHLSDPKIRSSSITSRFH